MENLPIFHSRGRDDNEEIFLPESQPGVLQPVSPISLKLGYVQAIGPVEALEKTDIGAWHMVVG